MKQNHRVKPYRALLALFFAGAFAITAVQTVFASTDNGKTYPHKKLMWPWMCHSYSDVNVLPDGRIGALICTANGTAVGEELRDGGGCGRCPGENLA